jgi:hypothetical protein
MAMTAEQLAQTFDALVREFIKTRPMPMAKTDLKAAADAAYTWATGAAIQTSYNSALPQPFRGEATQAEKAALLAFVCMRIAGK